MGACYSRSVSLMIKEADPQLRRPTPAPPNLFCLINSGTISQFHSTFALRFNQIQNRFLNPLIILHTSFVSKWFKLILSYAREEHFPQTQRRSVRSKKSNPSWSSLIKLHISLSSLCIFVYWYDIWSLHRLVWCVN